MTRVNVATLASLVVLACLVGNTYAFYGPETKVVNVDPSNFDSKVMKSSQVVLVEFYAPWCGHCKNLVPTWTKAAAALHGIAKVVAVDADKHKDLGQRFGVQGFPTIKVFGANKNKPTDYQGGRSVDDIVNAALKEVRSVAMSRLGKKAGGSGGSGGAGGSGGGSGGNGGSGSVGKDVITLTDDNFEEEVLKHPEGILVEFYAPWCGHCKNLAPEWSAAATELKGQFRFGAVDATVHQKFASKYGVRGYPTIKYFGYNGDKDGEDYQQARSKQALVDFALAKMDAAGKGPKVEELTDPDILKATCADTSKLCVIAFLPDILDDGAKGRQATLDMLLSAFKDSPRKSFFNFMWAQGGKQSKLEEALNMPFGYPSVAAFSWDKKRTVTHVGKFDATGIKEFMSRIATGKLKTRPFEHPKIYKEEPWDGKDGVMPTDNDEL
eukprot:TRINITY_DN2571_c1_g1_i1.p1 TRINITY_DN2571_c1_g1~~TRINITY_DN2571_c1_g1_i1.p1  ORF type:complete len:438 (+),score=145.45 TRINITY_DN2571_c1_g1_i1:159-1472(+)